jgi:hypothetical protein
VASCGELWPWGVQNQRAPRLRWACITLEKSQRRHGDRTTWFSNTERQVNRALSVVGFQQFMPLHRNRVDQRAVIPTSAEIDPPRMLPGSSGCWGGVMGIILMFGARACGLNFSEKKLPQHYLSATSALPQHYLSATSVLPLWTKSIINKFNVCLTQLIQIDSIHRQPSVSHV